MASNFSAPAVLATARGPFVINEPARPAPVDAVDHLEDGGILLVPPGHVPFPDADRDFLLALRRVAARKNIAYRPLQDKLTGASRDTDATRLHDIMRRFSAQAAGLAAILLPRYAAAWQLELASFRPIEEHGRQLAQHARNDLLHFDSFPTRPMNGHRILRFFINLNPTEDRVWIVSDPFDAVVERFARDPKLRAQLDGRESRAPRLLQRLGLTAARPPYDRFMLQFHNTLKDDAVFQQSCAKHEVRFPPGACWLVFTDMTSHAVVSGRFAIEQTFKIPPAAMAHPERAPAAILERLCGHAVTWA
jgi:hypothetical protein